MESSLNALGRISGINFIKSGNKIAPPGSRKTANAGTLLQISNNCSFTFFFSSDVNFLCVDFVNKENNSLLSLISLARRFLFL